MTGFDWLLVVIILTAAGASIWAQFKYPPKHDTFNDWSNWP